MFSFFKPIFFKMPGMYHWAKKTLDDLMGLDRNKDRVIQRKFSDDNVCKNYLVSFCPSQLFVNTKSDLGICSKIHDDKLKKEYLEASDKIKYEYESKFYDYLQSLIRDLERKIKKHIERLTFRGDDSIEKITQANLDEREERSVQVEEEIKRLQVEMEKFAEGFELN